MCHPLVEEQEGAHLMAGGARQRLPRRTPCAFIVRMQLRALFRKTETERQAEVITLLTRLQGL